MPYVWRDNDIRLEHRDVKVYWSYDGDIADQPLTFVFCLSPLDTHNESFDIRDWQGYKENDAEDLLREWGGWHEFVNSRIRMAVESGDIKQHGVNW
jgi:hypothetical protein